MKNQSFINLMIMKRSVKKHEKKEKKVCVITLIMKEENDLKR